MGLTHPADLEGWKRWQRAQQPLTRRMRAGAERLRLRGGTTRPAVLTRGGPRPRVLVALDATTPTAVGALLAPVLRLPAEDVAILSAKPLGALLPPGWTESAGDARTQLADTVTRSSIVLALGHYLELGSLAHPVAAERGARFVTVQHGLLTPHAPPLAPRTTLLAWSEADAAYWTAGRDDVSTTVVGSQLLWEAAEHPLTDVDPGATPVFLGQLHGAELPRRVLTEAAEGFCRSTGATYRPHPSETDRRSRATHRRWERSGIRVDRSATTLREVRAPVVSVFSTGVLEAAAAGIPAWVHLPAPPRWVSEFWTRYRLATWGGAPTASPERPPVAPSRAVAEVVRGMMAG